MTVLALLLGALLVGPADAKKKKKKKPPPPQKIERTVEYEYSSGSPGVPGVVGACMSVLAPDLKSACIDIPTSSEELFASVKVADASGGKPHVILAQDSNPDSPGFEIFADFCGETTEPLPITPGLALRVSVYAGGSPDCPAPATSGKISTTLSNMP